MISKIINWSIKNRIMVLLITLAIVAYGIFSLQKTPIDAIPDLSDVQVIVKTSYPGQAPQVVEDQVTHVCWSIYLRLHLIYPKKQDQR